MQREICVVITVEDFVRGTQSELLRAEDNIVEKIDSEEAPFFTRISMQGHRGRVGRWTSRPVEARKFRHDHPPTPNQRKKEHQHRSSDIFFEVYRWILRLSGSCYEQGPT